MISMSSQKIWDLGFGVDKNELEQDPAYVYGVIMASYQFLVVYIVSPAQTILLTIQYPTIIPLYYQSKTPKKCTTMSTYNTTAQDVQNQESRFGSNNPDVSAMKVRLLLPSSVAGAKLLKTILIIPSP